MSQPTGVFPANNSRRRTIEHSEYRDLERVIEFIVSTHQPDESDVICDECRHAWPCETAKAVAHLLGHDETHNRRTQTPEGVRLGRILARLEAQFGDCGQAGQLVLQQLHELVITPGLKVAPSLSNPGALEVSCRALNARPLLLWTLALIPRLRVTISCSITQSLGRKFLSELLVDSLSPIGTEELLTWWTSNGISQRVISFDLPESPKDSIRCLRALCEASTQTAIQQGNINCRDDSDDFF
jgi:hypothetical protein